LFCVPVCPKGSTSLEETIARGFATSPRLSVWCNLDLFTRLNWVVQRKLKGHDPRIALYIDDIGIMASRVEDKQMEEVSLIIEDMLNNFDYNQALPINPSKKEIIPSTGLKEHLGLRLGRNKISIGSKAKYNLNRVQNKLRTTLSSSERSSLIKRHKSYKSYNAQIEKENLKES